MSLKPPPCAISISSPSTTRSTTSPRWTLGRAASSSSASPPAPKDPLIGARLGVYQIIEPIGVGGMGSVYRAVRVDETFHKEVAVKVVHRTLDRERVIRQFRRERQIGASLDHPNIANLIDG